MLALGRFLVYAPLQQRRPAVTTGHSARVVYVRFVARIPEVLLVLQSGRTIGPHGRTKSRIWKLPGGRSLEGETPQDTAVRKFKEKTGKELPLDHQRFHCYLLQENKRFNETIFLAIDRNPDDPSDEIPFQSEEIDAVRWFPLAQIHDLHKEHAARGAWLGGPYLHVVRAMRTKYPVLFAPF